MYPNAYSIFQDSVKREALQRVATHLKGRTILAARVVEDSLSLILDDNTTVSYDPWHDYAEDSGVTLYINSVEVEQHADFIGPAKPPRTEEEEAAYRASLTGLTGLMYDEMKRITRELNRGGWLLKCGVVDELPESSS